jgi:predicted membrane-bound spermidine synthase
MFNKYLYFTVFVSGMSVLAIELSASRLLGSVFGTSNLVWASIIGLILIYLTVGYFIGGRWADRSPHLRTMYAILAWGAFTSGIVPLVARPVLYAAADAFDQLQVGVLFGSFSATLVLFIVPVTLLGMISPFAIRLAISDPREAGTVSGRIYAISTLGSFIGTFLPDLVLIPLMGTTLTFMTFAIILSLVALVGFGIESGWRGALRWAWMPLVLLIVALVFGSGAVKRTEGQIYESESAYNYIQVLELDGTRYLRLNEGQGVHSVYRPDQLDYDGPWELFLAAPFFNQPDYAPEEVESMAIVGLAAGTTARQASAVFGPIPIDGYEIDPEIIRIGKEYFAMDLPNLNAIAMDGRWGLSNSTKRYSIIGIDAYRPPYIPWHLTTQEFFQIVYDHLQDDGVMVVNVGRSPTDRSLIEGLVGTIGTIFPSIYVVDVPYSFNSIVYATRQPTEIHNLYDNLIYLWSRPEIHPLLVRAVETAVTNHQPTPQFAAGERVVFTDDHAPIEWITNKMVLGYVLFGDFEELQ